MAFNDECHNSRAGLREENHSSLTLATAEGSMRESNGAGAFEIHPKEDPLLKEVVARARRRTAMEKTLRRGARLLIDFLTDFSLWPGHNVKPGVVRLSNSDLARYLGASMRSIQRWKIELRARGLIFTREKFLRNSWPVTTYNVIAICGQETLPFTTDLEDGYVTDDD